MKEEIIGYITGMVDRNIRQIKMLEELNGNKGELRKYKNFKNELSDLLDFVVDIPEITRLKNTIRELEVLQTGEKSMERLRRDITYYRNRNTELESINRMWQIACNKLKEKNELLEGKLHEQN